MSSNYEQVFIQGIPYYKQSSGADSSASTSSASTSDARRKRTCADGESRDGCATRDNIFTFDANGPVHIGTAAESGNIEFFDDWKERVAERLESWRNGISAKEREKLRESISKPVKQRKPRRNNKKATTSVADP
jgi:hypothetical protein